MENTSAPSERKESLFFSFWLFNFLANTKKHTKNFLLTSPGVVFGRCAQRNRKIGGKPTIILHAPKSHEVNVGPLQRPSTVIIDEPKCKLFCSMRFVLCYKTLFAFPFTLASKRHEIESETIFPCMDAPRYAVKAFYFYNFNSRPVGWREKHAI